jgi:hypothetical protein
MPPAPRRSPHDGLTASEGEELVEAARRPDRLGLEQIDRYREVAAEYAERCVRALNGNDLRDALRAATISDAANRAVDAELRYQDRARELRERWERDTTLTPATGARGLAIAR